VKRRGMCSRVGNKAVYLLKEVLDVLEGVKRFVNEFLKSQKILRLCVLGGWKRLPRSRH
jgi:hypothetical protein